MSFRASVFSRKELAIIAGISIIASVFLYGAYVTGAGEVSSQTILETGQTVIGQDISYPSGPAQITSKIVTIPVGAETGPHIHEYPMFAYILEGEVSVDYGEAGVKTFVKGQSIVEAINYTHNGKNNGSEPTKILVVLMAEN